ncbi:MULTISPECIES: AAA family ATPase [unclassified Crossiella]|uniref:AAA family ATPase n=1 Tax=unclassified Crossiella TaxID=2620835 RepID=UPI001FFEDD27|nr:MULTISPECIES: AAA family ATPase [unclassified Crossiella]MCK2241000.1 ATP-binding protein [Crossiella sp. S99.2]MCK2253856.1 ATP-binding protein [Crossiella sp. S99.1]
MTAPAHPVEQPVTVAVLGTHSTGKSTFLARLAHDLRRRHISVGTVADLGEQAKRIGLPILFNHTWASTLWIMTRGISDELEAWLHSDVVLIDRPVPDALGYYRAALEYRREMADPVQIAKLEEIARGHSNRYDLTFRTTLDPTIPLGDNKIRDSDTEFRMLADRHVDEVLRDLELPHELLPADGHDAALDQAITFVTNRLTR